MDKKNKIFTSIVASGTILLGSLVFITQDKETLQPLAEECEHLTVQHHEGVINGENSEVEHWACCKCHTAWADEARTTVIGNTVSDRSKIKVNVNLRFNVDWNLENSKIIYNEKTGYSFKNYITNLDVDQSCAIETYNSGFTLDESTNECAYALVTNKTSQVIRADVHRRGWGNRVYSEYIAPNETKGFFVMAKDWNAEKSGDNYGFALLCYNTAKQEAGGYIEVTKPQFGHFDSYNLMSSIQSSNWQNISSFYNESLGLTLAADLGTAGGVLHIKDRVVTDESLYDGIYFDVYNATGSDITNRNIWSEGWNGHNTGTGLLKNGEWTTIFVSNYVWNFNPVVSIYDLPSSGMLYLTNFRLAEKPVFGPAENEAITIEDSGWGAADKVMAYDKGKSFLINYSGSKSFATNNGKQLDSSVYSKVYFYVYNGTGSSMSMYSTPDWAHNAQYGTIEPNVWTRCEIPVDEWNIAAVHYFYPTASAGPIYLSYFYADKYESLNGFDVQPLDLNIGTDGSLDLESTVTLDLVNDSRIKSIKEVKFNGNVISNSGTINVSEFGKTFGESSLEVIANTENGLAKINYPVLLCSKLIKTKDDLDSFPLIAGSLGDKDNFIYDGYFALANDIEYSANWFSFMHKNTFPLEKQFDPNCGFVGTFDGQGHIVNGLSIFPTEGDWNLNSFIYKLGKEGVIKNVGFTNARLTAAGGYISSIGEGTIEDVYVSYSNVKDYSDGLNTFFYFDRSNDLNSEVKDSSYKNSEPMVIKNCYVDASLLSTSSKTNTHVIGSKKYGYVNLKNVYAVCDSSLIDSSFNHKNGNAGSFVVSSQSELENNRAVMNDITNNFTASIFNHADVNVPKTYTGTVNTQNFIKNGETDYAIYANEGLSDIEYKALSLFADKVNEITGARIYTSLDNAVTNNCSISIFKDESLATNYKLTINDAKNIIVSYGSCEGLYKASIKLLETIFGYKNYNVAFEMIPAIDNVVNLTASEKIYSSFNGISSAYTLASKERQELAGLTSMDDTFVNVKSNYDDGSGQYHNMFFFLPPEIYYSDHPSWYTPNMESKGGYYNHSGLQHYSNLCFSANGNATELALMKDEFYARLKTNLLENPELNNICVGQNDNDHTRNSDYCGCNKCKSLANENIAFISFLNDMSQRIKADPDFAGRDIYLYMMAYRDTIVAPNSSDITCDDHVGVWIAPIDCNYAYALNDSINNSQTYLDIQGWNAITNNISFYMYNTNYVRTLAPFYSFETLVDNIKYMNSLNTKFVYYCEVYKNSAKTGFGALADYIITRLSFDISLTYEQLLDEFFDTDGYYGQAGPRMKYYFDELTTIMANNRSTFGNIYSSSVINILSTSLGSQSFWRDYAITGGLDELVTTDPHYLDYKNHIETEELLFRYVKYLTNGTWFSGDSISKFISDCKNHGITYISENVELTEANLNKQTLW